MAGRHMMTWQSEFLALHIYLLKWDHSTNHHVLSDANKQWARSYKRPANNQCAPVVDTHMHPRYRRPNGRIPSQ